MDCQTCGACCGHAGDRIVDKSDQSEDVSCSALTGEIGSHCSCGIYEQRPQACRDFSAGSEPCLDIRMMMLGI